MSIYYAQQQTNDLVALSDNMTEPPHETFDKFHLFPQLPDEVKLKIWKMALTGRRVVSQRTSLHITPRLDKTYLSLLWTCFDSRKIWRENFNTTFRDNSAARVRSLSSLHNFDVDSVAIDGGLGTLPSLTTRYPQSASKIQYLEMRTEIVGALKRMPSLKMITVIWDFGARKQPFPQPKDPGEYTLWHERFLISTLESLRRLVYSATGLGPTVPYKGPQLACLFPPTEIGIEELYFRTTHDLQHVSFGTLVGDSKVYQDPQVSWNEKNGLWGNDFYQSSNIFSRMTRSRTAINNMLPIEPQLLELLHKGTITLRDVKRYLEFDKKYVAYHDRKMARNFNGLPVEKGLVEDRAHFQLCIKALETQTE